MSTRTGGTAESWKAIPIGVGPVTVHAVKPEAQISLARPCMEAFPGGRIVVAMDQFGPGVRDLPDKKGRNPHFLKHSLQGTVFVSNDHGKTWAHKFSYPFANARLFRDGNTLYLMGDAGSIQIVRSLDGGNTWGAPTDLTARTELGDACALSPGNVLTARGQLYTAVMKVCDFNYRGALGSTQALVVMRATAGSNLLNPDNWKLSAPIQAFRDLIPHDQPNDLGVPFFKVPKPGQDADIANHRWAGRMGWYDPFLLQVKDPDHAWHDPDGRTFHILVSAETHRSNLAILARMTEAADGAMSLGWQSLPSSSRWVFFPLPGGHLKFDVLYDDASRHYWLASNQSRDSMLKPGKLPPDRFGLPCEEYHRLQLHFSKNLVDWTFAGLIDAGATPAQVRCEPALAVRGNDIHVVCRYGEPGARNARDTGRIAFYTVPNFRELI